MSIKYFQFVYEPDSWLWRFDEDPGHSAASSVRIRMEAEGKRFSFQHYLPQYDSLTDSEINHVCRAAADALKRAIRQSRASG